MKTCEHRLKPFCRRRWISAAAAAALLACAAPAKDSEEQRVDRIFAAYDKTDSPGCALGVIRDGEFIYRKGYGMASLELGVPITSRSLFYMGSVSKQFTAASVVLAAEQGLLSLDDSVRRYIPELPAYAQPVTLRQMLHHTSGFRDVLALLDLSGRSAADLHSTAEFLDLVTRQKALNYPPGEEYLYSNTNYFLLAQIVARVSKKRFSEFARENIFGPLGMTHTRFYDDHSIVVPGRIPAYAPGRNGEFTVDWSTNFDKVGDGGLLSSVDDLLLWDRNFYHNKLGKGTLIKELETRGVLNSGKQIDYALGLRITSYRGLPIVEHGGALFGYRTEILRFPEQHFTVLCLCNLETSVPGDLSHQVADVYLGKELGPRESTVRRETGQREFNGIFSPFDVAQYAALYRSTELDATFQILAKQRKLLLERGWDPPLELAQFGNTQAVTLDGRLTLTFIGSGGRITGFDLSAGRIHGIHFQRID